MTDAPNGDSDESEKVKDAQQKAIEARKRARKAQKKAKKEQSRAESDDSPGRDRSKDDDSSHEGGPNRPARRTLDDASKTEDQADIGNAGDDGADRSDGLADQTDNVTDQQRDKAGAPGSPNRPFRDWLETDDKQSEGRGPRDGPDDDASRRPSDASLNSLERYERSRILKPRPDYVVRFRFDETDPVGGDIIQVYQQIPEAVRDDQRTVIRVHVSASPVGTESYNQRLTEERGESIRREFEDLGIEAHIEVYAHGERLAREANRSLMQLDPASETDTVDDRDDAGARVAVVEVVPHVRSVDFSEGDTINVPDTRPLSDEYRAGEHKFEETGAPLGERIRDQVSSPENPVRSDPSADPGEFFLDQVPDAYGDMVKDAIKEPMGVGAIAGILGKELAGSFYEVLVRNQQIKEVPEQRLPLFRAAAEGFAVGIDPAYSPTWTPETPVERREFKNAQRVGKQLNKRERRQVKIYLIERARNFGLSSVYEPMSAEEIRDHWDGGWYAWAIVSIFQHDKRFDRQ